MLPALNEQLTTIMETKLSKSPGAFKLSPKILIVEDDLTSEPIWEHIIRFASPKASFDWATNEIEAESLIINAASQGLPYDLVISDIFLSGAKTGIDLWNKFHESLKGRMILISSVEHKKFAKYTMEHELKPIYIKKPLNINDCIETVYSLLRKIK